jgi:methionyl-tRNA synthetase
MIARYCDGLIPGPEAGASDALRAEAASLRAAVEGAGEDFDRAFDGWNFSRGIEAIWAALARVDRFISAARPWDLAKDPRAGADLALVLHTAEAALRHLVVRLAPVLPASTQTIWEQLGAAGQVELVAPASLAWGGAGTQIREVKPVFPRLEKEKLMEEIKSEEAASREARGANETQPAEATPAAATSSEAAAGIVQIGIEDFAKLDLRVGEVLSAERVPKADKLLRFSVDLGEPAPRQILAGIAEYYAPEQLIGRKVIVVANLAPRKLRGFESQGMILAASVGDEGRPVLAGFVEDVPNGARLK